MINDDKERYSRHILLSGVGEEGQNKLLNSKVLIVGAGGLGSPSAMYLAAAGVGCIGIADGDTVSLSNLQRQIIHTTKDIGMQKTLSAKERINNLNPNIKVITYPYYLDKLALVTILQEEKYDFVIEATDSFDSKYIVNDACVEQKTPYSHAGVMQFQGETMTYLPGHACYRCFAPTTPYNPNPNKGILGAVAGIIGTIQTTEALKYLLGIGKLITDNIMIYDALYMDCRRLTVHPNPNCVCRSAK